MSQEERSGKEVPQEPVVIRTADGTAYEVPVEGSLPLLALGYRGLMAWRAKRAQVQHGNTGDR